MSRPRSVNEYTLQRHLVVPLIEPESPPPSPPATYITSAELNRIAPQDWTRPSPLQRMGRSVGCDLPQHVAEKFTEQLLSVEDKEKAPVTTTCSSNSFVEQKQKAFLKLIPTISIDEDVGLREDSCRTWVRRPTLLSVASSCISENSSMTIFSIDKNHFVSSRIQRLVSAFTDRAKALKDRIAQPPTPSTDSSDHEGRGPAPHPPPLSLRIDSAPGIEPKRTWINGSKPFRLPRTFHPQSNPSYSVNSHSAVALNRAISSPNH